MTLFGSGVGAAVQVSFVVIREKRKHVRLFLFHTALASGAAPDLLPEPVAAALEVDIKLLPDFATSRGFDIRVADAVAELVAELPAPLSPDLGGVGPVAPFAARKVLLTDTALNDIGFLTVEEVRTWPSAVLFDFTASLSDPPLTLTSADVTATSAASRIGVAVRSTSIPSFTVGGLAETS